MMAENNGRIKLERAQFLAQEFISSVRDVCERIEIAGSVRREKHDVKDAEVVVIPKVAGGINLLWNRLDTMVIQPGSPIQKALYSNGDGKKPVFRWGGELSRHPV